MPHQFDNSLRHVSGSVVKIFGERNTGTNLAKWILERNKGVTILPSTSQEALRDLSPRIRQQVKPLLGHLPKSTRKDFVFLMAPVTSSWKHAATNFRSARAFEGTSVIFTVRHPVSWLVAFARRPYATGLGKEIRNLELFSRTQIRTPFRERLGGRSFSPVAIFRRKILSYVYFDSLLSKLGVPTFWIRHEDAVVEPTEVFSGLPFPSLHASFKVPETGLKPGGLSFQENREYYRNELWRREVSKDLHSWVMSGVGLDILDRFGYH